MINLKRFFVFFLIAVLISGCSSKVLIDSKPQGAKVYINDEYKGVTPYEQKDRFTIFEQPKVVLELDGYKSYEDLLTKDVPVYPCLVCGYFLVFPMFWSLKYEPYQLVELEPGKGVTHGKYHPDRVDDATKKKKVPEE